MNICIEIYICRYLCVRVCVISGVFSTPQHTLEVNLFFILSPLLLIHRMKCGVVWESVTINKRSWDLNLPPCRCINIRERVKYNIQQQRNHMHTRTHTHAPKVVKTRVVFLDTIFFLLTEPFFVFVFWRRLCAAVCVYMCVHVVCVCVRPERYVCVYGWWVPQSNLYQ